MNLRKKKEKESFKRQASSFKRLKEDTIMN